MLNVLKGLHIFIKLRLEYGNNLTVNTINP